MRRHDSNNRTKKLDLGRTETVRVLSDIELNHVAGGTSAQCGISVGFSCGWLCTFSYYLGCIHVP